MQQNETYTFVFCKLIFSRADERMVEIMMDILREFVGMLGLQLNLSKSFIFVSNSFGRVKNSLVALTGFQEGTLPVTSLGFP